MFLIPAEDLTIVHGPCINCTSAIERIYTQKDYFVGTALAPATIQHYLVTFNESRLVTLRKVHSIRDSNLWWVGPG